MRGELATRAHASGARQGSRAGGTSARAQARSGYADAGRGVERVTGTRGARHQQQWRKR
jgi:hypothetical protein